MNIRDREQHRGFIQAIVVTVAALIVLGYFGFNLSEVIKNPNVQSNLNWAWNISKNAAASVWQAITEPSPNASSTPKSTLSNASSSPFDNSAIKLPN